MGLDATIHKSKGSILSTDCEEEDFIGDELIYFRKFYALNNWIQSNCETLKHSIVDGNKITRNDLLKLKSELNSKKDPYFFDEYFVEKLAELNTFLYKEIESPSCECYYYKWIN